MPLPATVSRLQEARALRLSMLLSTPALLARPYRAASTRSPQVAERSGRRSGGGNGRKRLPRQTCSAFGEELGRSDGGRCTASGEVPRHRAGKPAHTHLFAVSKLGLHACVFVTLNSVTYDVDHALRVGSITTSTSAGSVSTGNMSHNWARSEGVVRNRRPDQTNRRYRSPSGLPPRRSSRSTAVNAGLPAAAENDPHQTFANRDPPRRVGAGGHRVPKRAVILRQWPRPSTWSTGKESRSAPIGQATTTSGCRTPRSSHHRPDDPGTLRATPSLNVRDDLLRDTERVNASARARHTARAVARSEAVTAADPAAAAGTEREPESIDMPDLHDVVRLPKRRRCDRRPKWPRAEQLRRLT